MAKPPTAPRSGAQPFQAVDRAYKDRLRYILGDEDFGPKLARLSRKDQQTVLQLVYRNKGREARRAILDLDRARRHKATVAGRARRYAALPPDQRTAQWAHVRERAHADDEDAQFWALYRNALPGA